MPSSKPIKRKGEFHMVWPKNHANGGYAKLNATIGVHMERCQWANWLR